MAKKKNQTKKHKFKYAQPDSGVSSHATAQVNESAAGQNQPQSKVRMDRAANNGTLAMSGVRDFSYVASDLRRVLLLAASLVALEVLLWLLFTHTGLGNAVYSLVRV
jgi:hypothetical protein